jgi:hypothetical protein
MKKQNARFWVWANNAPAKVTLRPGQSVTHFTYARHDEGFYSTQTTWTHDGEGVDLSYYSAGTDCDGRHENGLEGFCPLDMLAAGIREDDLPPFPKWKYGPTAYRDYYAEAMGY